MKITVLKLTKHWGINTAGEVIGVSEEVAKRDILDKSGGEEIDTYDNATSTAVVEYDAKTNEPTGLKVTPIKAAPAK